MWRELRGTGGGRRTRSRCPPAVFHLVFALSSEGARGGRGSHGGADIDALVCGWCHDICAYLIGDLVPFCSVCCSSSVSMEGILSGHADTSPSAPNANIGYHTFSYARSALRELRRAASDSSNRNAPTRGRITVSPCLYINEYASEHAWSRKAGVGACVGRGVDRRPDKARQAVGAETV